MKKPVDRLLSHVGKAWDDNTIFDKLSILGIAMLGAKTFYDLTEHKEKRMIPIPKEPLACATMEEYMSAGYSPTEAYRMAETCRTEGAYTGGGFREEEVDVKDPMGLAFGGLYGIIALKLATAPLGGGQSTFGIKIFGSGVDIPFNSQSVGLVMLGILGLINLKDLIPGLDWDAWAEGQREIREECKKKPWPWNTIALCPL